MSHPSSLSSKNLPTIEFLKLLLLFKITEKGKFEEIKLKLNLLKETYDKSNDQKIIQSGIKDLTGNVLTDKEILSLINNCIIANSPGGQ